MPSVFVLMPFDEGFTPVYSDFIKEVLEQEGFKVLRADDIQSQQNILRDIIQGIAEGDLIIADLTSSNPNVYYELGIAHALGKPVIHLVQSPVEDVPFDLRSYRLMTYNTHFAEINQAREKLAEYARKFREGGLPTGNPVTDFHPGVYSANPPDPGASPPDDAKSNDSESMENWGVLDHIIAVIEGYNGLAAIFESMTDDVEQLGRDFVVAVEDIERINANPNQSSLVATRSVLRRLADKTASYNERLESNNTEFSEIMRSAEDSLELAVSFSVKQSGMRDPDVVSQMNALRELRQTGEDTRAILIDMMNSINVIPRVERRLNRELDGLHSGIGMIVANIDSLIASTSRALNIFDADLESDAGLQTGE